MISKQQKLLLETLESIEVPDSAYDKAIERYEDLSEFLGRDESPLAQHDPDIYAQGSFATGTAIKGLKTGSDELDLDLVLHLRSGLTPQNISQKALTEMVFAEVEAYRKARQIQTPAKTKKRCVTLLYKGSPGFHMDVLHALPGDQSLRTRLINEAVVAGMNAADVAAEHALFITDNTLDSYPTLSPDWEHANPKGFRLWFVRQMSQRKEAGAGLDKRIALGEAQIESVPVYRRKTPLQRAIQWIKRHRDVHFKDKPDSKPISIILTTIAAGAYDGDQDLVRALKTVGDAFRTAALTTNLEVRNPIYPKEIFTDRWDTAEGREHDLRDSFRSWSMQLARDIDALTTSECAKTVSMVLEESLGVNVTDSMRANLPAAAAVAAAPTVITSSQVSARPWSE